ncbi:MAG: hypothetical protein U5K75_00290 [Ahrensia sp.]|nr:hypothetical protein [Ahrensia sp.]
MSTMRADDSQIIREGLLNRCEDLCFRLLPSGKREGGGVRWVAHDPVAGDYNKTPALSVVLTGEKRGRWQSFRGVHGHAKFDLIGLIAYVRSYGTDMAGTLPLPTRLFGLAHHEPGRNAKNASQSQ